MECHDIQPQAMQKMSPFGLVEMQVTQPLSGKYLVSKKGCAVHIPVEKTNRKKMNGLVMDAVGLYCAR